jgi:uncharacterized RDD family membrane protein YckC
MNPILDAPVATDRRLEYAGFWIRFVAAFIDGIVLSVVNWVLAFAFIGSSFSFADPDTLGTGVVFYYLITGALSCLYFAIMESSERQATLGKMAVGVKVGDEIGQRITLGNAIGRWFSKILSALILMIGYIMAGFDSRKQALHDKLASTVVYYG